MDARDTTDVHQPPNDRDTVNAAAALGAWLIVALGLLVLAAPFIVDAAAEALWLDLAVGALLVILGAYQAWDAGSAGLRTATWPAALAALLGVVLIVAPFVLPAARGYWWVNVVAGVGAVGAALYTYWTAHSAGARRDDAR